jgi:hypothetical protein
MTQESELTTAITVADLNTLVSLIEVCASRGAIRPQEFTSVGAVFDKLTTTLQQVKKTDI